MSGLAKILVANRGEIAVRVIRAGHALGIPTVAVHSEADATALHVGLADEAVCIGPPSPLESYLDIDRIIEAARATGADSIHPGYGFLAENAAFARRCAKEGITFIGPPAEAIELLGDKLAARAAMETAGVPVTPGGTAAEGDEEAAVGRAESIGYPIMVKAAAGGGGKGMRIAHDADELRDALAGARREAHAAFGDATVFIEKMVEHPRHVEIQVLADTHGGAVHLFERECSIQRRHQKIIEEAPSPALDDAQREAMGAAALEAVRASGYVNAGTVEFLLDRSGAFYFLEVNTRIQVEHPVTEAITGIDLVAEQIRIAAGEPLGYEQSDLKPRGHAIEARIYAEDPAAGFMPSIGTILRLREPSGPGVRVDSGIREGGEITVHYDPILSKVIAHGADREQARRRLVAALRELTVLGVTTTGPYLIDVLEHPAFASAALHTGFLKEHFDGWAESDDGLEIALAAATLASGGAKLTTGSGAVARPSPWQSVGIWEIGDGR